MIERQMEREEDILCEQLNRGEITLEEFNNGMRDMQREYRAMAEEAAQQAYDDEMGRW